MSTRAASLTSPCTLADVINRIDDLVLSKQHRADLKSSVRCYCKAVGQQPASVLADLDKLRKRLASMTAASVNVSSER